MNEFIKILNKYIILLIASSLFSISWMFIHYILVTNYTFSMESLNAIGYIPLLSYLINIIVAVLLIIDFNKYNLKNIVITCIAALCFPLLGIVIFAILFLLKEKEEIC